VNPTVYLAREVQPLFIYIKGDDRLNNTQSQNQSTNISRSSFCSRSSVFFILESLDPRSPRGGRTDLGQPITAVRPDGVSPGRVGFRVLKRARRIVLRIALPASLLRRRVLRIALNARGTR
jgi:hypothetical protein